MSFDEAIKLAEVLSPVILAIIGYLLIKKVESIKTQIARNSDFSSKWASEFFTLCSDYMSAIERYLALLHFLGKLEDKNSKLGIEIQTEITQLNIKLPQLQLRLKRLSVFAIREKVTLLGLSDNIHDKLSAMVNNRAGNFDEIITLLDQFNQSAKRGHAEMIGLPN